MQPITDDMIRAVSRAIYKVDPRLSREESARRIIEIVIPMVEQRATAGLDALPEAWQDLINGLILLGKHHTDAQSPLDCGYDGLHICSDEGGFTDDELDQLHVWGFDVDPYQGEFRSVRFGST